MFLNNHKIVASNKLAIDLQQGVLAELRKYYKGVKDGGVREGPFWVLVGAQMPAVLIEVGFITHPIEAKRLVNKLYQKRFAKGIADGIERYFIKNR
jgi:N-acetylmuramoyl-L-alanine amidase